MQGKKKKCSTIFPLIKGFFATTYFKGFILNAVAAAIIAALSIEMRSYLDRQGRKVKGEWELSDATKTIIVVVSGFTIAMIVYVLMYIFVGFGGGMLTDNTF
jgi:hypothetical protein